MLLHRVAFEIRFDMVQEIYVAHSILKPFLQSIEPYMFPIDFDVGMIFQKSVRHGLCSHFYSLPEAPGLSDCQFFFG